MRSARALVVGLAASIQNAVGLDEILVSIALVLVTVALWPTFARGALLAPGLVLLWVALPARSVFLIPPPVDKPKRRTR